MFKTIYRANYLLPDDERELLPELPEDEPLLLRLTPLLELPDELLELPVE